MLSTRIEEMPASTVINPLYTYVQTFQGRTVSVCCPQQCEGHKSHADTLRKYADYLVQRAEPVSVHIACIVNGCNRRSVASYFLPTSPLHVRVDVCEDHSLTSSDVRVAVMHALRGLH